MAISPYLLIWIWVTPVSGENTVGALYSAPGWYWDGVCWRVRRKLLLFLRLPNIWWIAHDEFLFWCKGSGIGIKQTWFWLNNSIYIKKEEYTEMQCRFPLNSSDFHSWLQSYKNTSKLFLVFFDWTIKKKKKIVGERRPKLV